MKDKVASEPRTAAWVAGLNQMQQTLGQSLELAVEPGQVPPPEMARAAAVPLQALDERLARLQACLKRAEQNAQEADAVLEAEAQALQRWLETMRQAGRRLAEWTRRPE